MALARGKPAPSISKPPLLIQTILAALRTKIRDGQPEDPISIKVRNAASLLPYIQDGMRLRLLVDIYSRNDPDEMAILDSTIDGMPLDLDLIRMAIDAVEYRRKDLNYKEGGFE